GGAALHTVAVRLDAAAVHLDQVAGDGQPEAQSAVLLRDRRVALVKALEDVGQDVGGDADPGVPHDDLGVVSRAPGDHRHTAAVGGELDRVGEQVLEDLLEPGGVAPDREGAGLPLNLDADPLAVGRSPHQV